MVSETLSSVSETERQDDLVDARMGFGHLKAETS